MALNRPLVRGLRDSPLNYWFLASRHQRLIRPSLSIGPAPLLFFCSFRSTTLSLQETPPLHLHYLFVNLLPVLILRIWDHWLISLAWKLIIVLMGSLFININMLQIYSANTICGIASLILLHFVLLLNLQNTLVFHYLMLLLFVAWWGPFNTWLSHAQIFLTPSTVFASLCMHQLTCTWWLPNVSSVIFVALFISALHFLLVL